MSKVIDKVFNKLPIGWDRKKLSELGETYTGLSGKTKKDFENGNYPMLAYMDVYGNTFVYQPSASVFINRDENQNSINYGDILFTTSSETPDEVAISSVYLGKSNNPIFLNSFCFGYRFFDLEYTNPLFYGYYFRSDYFRSLTFRLAQGSTRFNISKNKLIESSIHVPPLKEQQKIADILSTVDTQIEQTEQMIEQTKELKHGLMQQLLTKGIGHTEFKNSAIGEIPLSWNLVKLGEIASRISVGYVGSINKYYTDEKGVILLRTGNIKSGNIDLNDIKYVTNEFHKKNNKSQLEPGDIIVSRHGDSGSVAVIPEELSNANCLNVVVVKKSELMNSTFIAYLFNSGFIKAILSKTKAGSVQGVINTKDIQEVTIPYPSLEEQQKISEILSSVDDQIDIYEKEKEKYEELKKGLMQQLLTGKIRVKVDE